MKLILTAAVTAASLLSAAALAGDAPAKQQQQSALFKTKAPCQHQSQLRQDKGDVLAQYNLTMLSGARLQRDGDMAIFIAKAEYDVTSPYIAPRSGAFDVRESFPWREGAQNITVRLPAVEGYPESLALYVKVDVPSVIDITSKPSYACAGGTLNQQQSWNQTDFSAPNPMYWTLQ